VLAAIPESQWDAVGLLVEDLIDLRAERFPPVPTFAEIVAEYEASLPPTRGLIDGGRFIFDIPPGIPSLWGDDDKRVFWARGEPFVITGPQGVGKTTDAGQLAFGLVGVPGFESLYGLPVKQLPPAEKVLYLALDRLRQIARALRRMAPPEHRDLIASRLIVQQGSDLPFSKSELLTDDGAGKLAEWAQSLGASVVVVDSLKDLVAALSDDEAAARTNTVIQACIARGVEVLILHHQRKAQALNKKPKTLDDVHGGANLTRGSGSVVLLWGAPGDEEIEVTHLKQAAEVVETFVVRRDHEAGRSVVEREGALELPEGGKMGPSRVGGTWDPEPRPARPMTAEQMEKWRAFVARCAELRAGRS
jgi:replicative DNA helicase